MVKLSPIKLLTDKKAEEMSGLTVALLWVLGIVLLLLFLWIAWNAKDQILDQLSHIRL